ncbi:MAG: DUF6261 family protein [Tannerella sp.]|jgi:hypothetical protein|nr:DUF6261 family protein [Tannerella sp.]
MKRQIIRVHFENLRNETHVELHETVIAAIGRYNPVQFGIESVYAGYRQLVTTEVSLLDIMQKSEYTVEIQAQDCVCGRYCRGLSDAIESGLNHFDAGKREAAGERSTIFDRYGSIAARTLDEGTAAIDDFLHELASGTASACVRTLALTDWVEQIGLENRKLKDLLKVDCDETAKRPLLRMHTVRVDVDKALQTILNFFDVVSTGHGLAAYELLLNDLNAAFERYRNILAQQAGAQGKTVLKEKD